ncbi:hypothetical protein ACIQRS_15105 [Streptomyces termitum]|uniref:Uncharacterized protein n=1 Tax=Streptomyces termitum TaxID=67368 RepID=A0A918TA44_9ACTN|nr:hypothetical protein [Streptomyces termitum]GHA98134.1 hypothetical protein GCM10010305_46970 [Streptomyces termitum]
MNLDIATAAAVTEDLVIEDFCAAADSYQPSTCICWTGEAHAE